MQHVLLPVVGWYEGLVSHVQSIRLFSTCSVIHVLHDGTCVGRWSAVAGLIDHMTDVSTYDGGYSAFASRFRCHAAHSREFELACYRRHFVCLEYAQRHHLDSFWYFDWDVLVLCDLEMEAAKVRKRKGLRWGGNNYVGDVPFFSDYLSRWKDHPVVTSGSVENADQHLEQALRNTTDITQHYVGSCSVQEDDSCFDGNLATSEDVFLVNEGRTQAEGMKVLFWLKNGCRFYPHAFHHKLNRWIRLKSLHCWGVHKKRIGQYLDIALKGAA